MATVDRKDEYGTAKYDVNGQDQMDLHPNDSQDNALRKIRTAGSVAIPPELFEKLYLNPESKVKDLWQSDPNRSWRLSTIPNTTLMLPDGLAQHLSRHGSFEHPRIPVLRRRARERRRCLGVDPGQHIHLGRLQHIRLLLAHIRRCASTILRRKLSLRA